MQPSWKIVIPALMIVAALVGAVGAQVFLVEQYTATVDVFIYITDMGLYADPSCIVEVTTLNFGTISNRNPDSTITRYLCNTGTTNLNITIDIYKVQAADNSTDNNANSNVSLLISNMQQAWNQSVTGKTVISLDFSASIKPLTAVAGAYRWNVTIAAEEIGPNF